MKFLVVGLGNPGEEYAQTRHNIGFMVLDVLASVAGSAPVDFISSRYGWRTQVRRAGHQLVLLKPSTYMNLSGQAVRYWLGAEKLGVEQLLVITDDLSLPVGRLRLRGHGSAGGHNGLSHIEETLGTQAYARVRFGIGADFPKGRQVDHVLGSFGPAEWPDVVAGIDRCVNLVSMYATSGLAHTMTDFNKG
ncbi:MAG: aminoacyl-tRNA hydrolase [Sphingomonadales bacterium]|nr:aminoacyl-tRNA hydrolase [Sphingomonadales bacterium]